MRLLHAEIENFKGLDRLEIPIRTDWQGAPRPLTVLTGDNGSGKTTALQALALTLGLATRRLPSLNHMEWHGFVPERLDSSGRTRVVATVGVSKEESDLTRWLWEQWARTERVASFAANTIRPGDHEVLELVFQDGHVDCTQGASGLGQLWGRDYIKRLVRERPQLRDLYRDVGDVFWFDQFRNIATTRNDETDGVPGPAWSSGVASLRDALVRWWGYHVRSDREKHRDWMADLEERVARVFPGTRFVGPEPIGPGDDGMWFLLERDGRTFDLAELSSGEQAAFALLHPFAYQAIHHSVVLVDEVELHLHPGTQQALVRVLRDLAPDCQWILTTHSPHVADAFPDDVIRLPGGTPCL